MAKNFSSELRHNDVNQKEKACQWAESELGNLLQRESGLYLDEIARQPEATATGLEQFISTTLESIAYDKYNDPYRAYQMTKTILEYVVASTFKGNPYRSAMMYPRNGIRHTRLSVADTGIQVGVYHTTEEPESSVGIKKFGESAMERNEDTMRLLGALASSLGTTEIDDSFTAKLPTDSEPIPITELVTSDQVFAVLHTATHDIDIVIRPEDTPIQKVA